MNVTKVHVSTCAFQAPYQLQLGRWDRRLALHHVMWTLVNQMWCEHWSTECDVNIGHRNICQQIVILILIVVQFQKHLKTLCSQFEIQNERFKNHSKLKNALKTSSTQNEFQRRNNSKHHPRKFHHARTTKHQSRRFQHARRFQQSRRFHQSRKFHHERRFFSKTIMEKVPRWESIHDLLWVHWIRHWNNHSAWTWKRFWNRNFHDSFSWNHIEEPLSYFLLWRIM